MKALFVLTFIKNKIIINDENKKVNKKDIKKYTVVIVLVCLYKCITT